MDSIASTLSKKIEESIAEHKEYISSGAVENYEDYAGLCGVIKGLRHCLMELKSVSKEIDSYLN